MPGTGFHFQRRAGFTQHHPAGDYAIVIKIQYHKAAFQGQQKFEGMSVPVRTDIGAGFHRNGEALYRVA